MGLSKRARNGVKESGSGQKWSESKTVAVAIAAILAIILVMFAISNSRKKHAAREAQEAANDAIREASDKAQRQKERDIFRQYEADRAAGIVREVEPMPIRPPSSADYGRAMGHMIAIMGKSYPNDSEIEQMAKTKAVDAGHRPDNPIFIRSFKSAFAVGYREGRLKYNAR